MGQQKTKDKMGSSQYKVSIGNEPDKIDLLHNASKIERGQFHSNCL